MSRVPLTVHPMWTMKGTYQVSIGLFENERPIEFGMKNGEDGFYPIGTTEIK